MKMKKVNLLIMASSLAWASASTAKSLDLSQVSDDANWVMHVDFDAARTSKIGSFIMDKISDNDEAAERVAKMKESFGVDPEGFSSLTLFGNGEREKGIAIMKGGMDPDKLVAFAQLNENLKTTQKGKYEIHSLDNGKRHSMAFTTMKGNVIVGGPDAEYVSHGIQLVKGKAASREPIGLLDELRAIVPNPGVIAYLNVAKAAKFHDLDDRGAAMVGKAHSAGMIIGEGDGELKMAGILKATNEETAKQIEEMVRGGLAMAAIAKESNPRMANVWESQKVTRVGNTVIVQIGLSIRAIKDGIKKEMDKNI